MRRIPSLILIGILVLSVLSGCTVKKSDEPATITILMDVMGDNDPLRRSDISDFQAAVDLFFPDKNITIEVEQLSSDLTERQTQLANIRTEIMAGGGPDVFILPTWSLNHRFDEKGNDLGRNEPLFTDVEDAMRNRIFLSLNELITESEHYKPEEHISTMFSDAGWSDG